MGLWIHPLGLNPHPQDVWIGFTAWGDAVKMILHWRGSEDRSSLKTCGIAVWILQLLPYGFGIVLCHVSCPTKLCTGNLVHPPAISRRANVKRIQRRTEDEDVKNCCVNFATLALRVWHCSVPCFMSKETVHLYLGWYASGDSCMSWKRISNQRMGAWVLRLPRLPVQLNKLSWLVLTWYE